MADFTHADLTGSRFEWVDLSGADLRAVDLADARFRGVNLSGVVMRGVERLWGETVERARRLDPDLLHESVDEEWSFIETLRHLVFATGSWVRRAILGDPSPWDALDLPWDEMADTPGVPRDRDVRCASACCAFSTRSGSTGCMPSGTWAPWQRATPNGSRRTPPSTAEQWVNVG